MEQGIAELQSLLGENGVTTDDDELHRHGFSDWSTSNADRLPVAVAYPTSTEDVSAIARICSRWKIPMGMTIVDRLGSRERTHPFPVPFSGGSSLEANFSAPFGGISIDFAFMDKILTVHPEEYVNRFGVTRLRSFSLNTDLDILVWT